MTASVILILAILYYVLVLVQSIPEPTLRKILSTGIIIVAVIVFVLMLAGVIHVPSLGGAS